MLEINDDGKGFDLQEVLPHSGTIRAYGLLGMRERVDLFGGKLVIESSPGAGTRVSVVIPITESSADFAIYGSVRKQMIS